MTHLLLLLALLLAVFPLYALFKVALTRLIQHRLGGYVQHLNENDAGSSTHALPTERSVAVLGSGVAGLTAALTLARRGYKVTIFEKNQYIGGKLGSWSVELSPGRHVWVSHGFHAFFRHYYNLNRLLDSLELRRNFTSIGDYVILGRDGSVQRFADLDTTPLFNLASMWKAGAFSLRDAFAAPGRDCYGIFLEYEQEDTFAKYDHLSFAEFAEKAKVPPRLLMAFNTFARAFFADADRLSFAELVKSFHFYYLSHNGGLVYDFPTDDYEVAILAPLRAELHRLGATIQLQTPVQALAVQPVGFTVDGSDFDRVVVATDVVGSRMILSSAQGVPEQIRQQFDKLQPGQRYSVFRIWIDREIRKDIPVFVITEKLRVLDSVTVLSRFEASSRRDALEHNVHILELHCYSVPDEMAENEIRDQFLKELVELFPEMEGMVVVNEYLQIRQDFTAFHVGCDAGRPGVKSGIDGLVFAGDWVKLNFPAMLLEASCASGLVAANAILELDGLQAEQVLSVPPRGLFAGMKEPPARGKILAP